MKITSEKMRRYVKVGIALSAEKDINKLLDMIVNEACYLAKADAGTLYLLDKKKRTLRFAIMQNQSLKTHVWGENGLEPSLKDVKLYDDAGHENHCNVSSHVALTGQPVNIPDVYAEKNFDFTGPREYDASTGYKSVSMMVIPLKNHEESIIGVLQLLNSKDLKTGQIVPFRSEYEEMIASLASLAAVALTNVQLINDLKELFYAFIKSIATAIEKKSPFTGGHIKRVVSLTMLIANHINGKDAGCFKDIQFTSDEMEELKMAAWMHDVGKITTPEYIVNKETKLHVLADQIKTIETRFSLIKSLKEKNYLTRKIELVGLGQDGRVLSDSLEAELNKELIILEDELNFLKKCNLPGEFLADGDINRIKEIGNKTYQLENKTHPYLTPLEIKNLCIQKGTLNTCERQQIENHAAMTISILEELPFPKHLARVPEYAGGHHEKLDGSGYPNGLTENELSLQARIMAIADIFESLTAKDRPYRTPITLSKALEIMEYMKKDGHIDPHIFDLFKTDAIYKSYAEKELAPEQIDQ